MFSHLTIQAAEEIIRAKKRTDAPEIIASITLEAAKSTARRIIDVRIVPKMPVSISGKFAHPQSEAPEKGDFMRAMAKYTTAMPKITHKKAEVNSIAAEYFKNAAIIPIITLDTAAMPLQLQFILHILSPPDISYEPHLRLVMKYKKELVLR